MIEPNYKMRKKLQDEGFRKVKDGLWFKEDGELKMYVDFRKNRVSTYGYRGDDHVNNEYLRRLYKFLKFENDHEQLKLDEMFG